MAQVDGWHKLAHLHRLLLTLRAIHPRPNPAPTLEIGVPMKVLRRLPKSSRAQTYWRNVSVGLPSLSICSQRA